MTSLLFGFIFNFTMQASNTIDLGDCEILKIDSIAFCSSHYSISVLTSIDTFTTVVEKSLIVHHIDSLIGKTRKITGEPMKSVTLEINDAHLTLHHIKTQLSHRAFDSYGETTYSWKIKKRFWKKEKVSLTLSHLDINNEQMNLLITKIE